jgi:hypothetical protein
MKLKCAAVHVETTPLEQIRIPALMGSGTILVQPSRIRRSYRKETKAVD